MLTDQELIHLNQRGLFPSPKEDVSAFTARTSSLSSLQPHSLPLYQINPDWIEIAYSSEGLSFWEGGATWCSPEGIIIRIKKNFLTKFYPPQEIPHHEIVHACRSSLDSPKFEEFFAYKTSSQKWRQFLGPIIQTPKESSIFLFSLSLPLFHPLGFSIPFILIALGFTRLIHHHRIINRCAQKLSALLSQDCVWPFMMRLTDAEIILFSRSNPSEIQTYIHDQKDQSLRWRMLFLMMG